MAKDYFVSPTGLASGVGSEINPWDLTTALAGGTSATKIVPGDTVNLRGGLYDQKPYYISNLTGNSSAYIKVQSYPGEWAVIDRARVIFPTDPVDLIIHAARFIDISGSYTIYRDFEITNSAPNRICSTDPCAQWTRGNAFGPGSYNKFVNLVIHDTDCGPYTSSSSYFLEFYGNVIYNNGTIGPDRGHGHGIYLHNNSGTKYVTDNIIFSQYSYGLHAYSESGTGNYIKDINYMNFQGNTVFANGDVGGARKTNILVGGVQADPAEWPVLKDNYSYNPGTNGYGLQMGYQTGCYHPQIVDNYITGGSSLISFVKCSDINLSNNTFYGTSTAINALSGLFPNNTFFTTRPSTNKIFIRANKFERGRANITVFNWANSAIVSADLSQANVPVDLRIGERYEIRDAQNYLSSASVVTSGIFDGSPISIDMTKSTTIAQPAPYGDPRYPDYQPGQTQNQITHLATHTPLEFGVFVLRRTGTPEYLFPTNVAETDNIKPSIPKIRDAFLLTSNQINLIWPFSFDNALITGATSYKIFQNGSLLTSKTAAEICAGLTCSFTDSNLSPNTTFIYAVSALDAAGNESDQSSTVSITTPSSGVSTITFQKGKYPTSSYSGVNDSYISGYGTEITSNFNSSSMVKVASDKSALIKWDTSLIPSGSTVTAVDLTFFINDKTGIPFQIYPLKKFWLDSKVTWNLANTSISWEIPGAQGTSDRGVDSLGIYQPSGQMNYFHHILLNSSGIAVVQNWINNPSQNYGLIITGSTNTDSSEFYSTANGVVYSPRLTVTYSPAGNHFDISDIRSLLSSFTSIFDYNNLVANYGK